MAQVLGRVTIKQDGKILLNDKGAKLNLGGVKRDPVVGDEVHGYVEAVEAPFIECNISVRDDVDLDAIHAMTNGTCVFETDIGKTWVLQQAWSSTPPEMTAGEGGKVPVKFYGKKCEPM